MRRPLADVEVWDKGGDSVLVFPRDFQHGRAQVWALLTEAEQVGRWAPYLADRDLIEVGEVVLTMVDGDRQEAMSAEVSQVEPMDLLEYSLGEDGLRWELSDLDGGTRVTLHHRCGQGREWLPKLAAGWHLCLDVAESLLDGRPKAPVRGQQAMMHGWQALHDRYAQALQPEEESGDFD